MRVDAGQAEILRAVQRDSVIKKRIHDNLSQLISSTFGPTYWVKWRHYIETGSKFSYQALTTLCNLQTLGEEHTGIIHWTDQLKLPSRQAQLLMIFLNCFGERLAISLIDRLEKYLENLPADNELRPEARQALLRACLYARKFIPIVALIHQTVFYFQGRYFDLSKRLTGIRYRLIRYWVGDRSMVSTFRIIGVISLIHLMVTVYSTVKELRSPQLPSNEPEVTVTSGATCVLCLNTRKNTSATPCGHLFCWGCILNWVQEQPFCPLCRQAVEPSRVVYLQNYGSA